MKTTTNSTGGLLLFGVGRIKNKNKQKNRTNFITNSSTESKTEEEQEHDGGDTAMTSGGVDPMEHKYVNMESEETEEARVEVEKKKAHN